MFVSHLLIVCTCLGTNVLAGVITGSISSSTSTDAERLSFLDMDVELAKIKDTCLSDADYEQMTGNYVKAFLARGVANVWVPESVAIIGFQEMRKVLKFSPPHTWQSHNDTKPTSAEMQSASTPEAYYDLRENRIASRHSYAGEWLFQHNVATVIEFLDARFPSIRAMFKKAFEAKHPKNEVVDKLVVDQLINEYSEIFEKIDSSTKEMMSYKIKCQNSQIVRMLSSYSSMLKSL
ncbi:hypothetical protein B9Z55_005966 [Caenorhabditis nigoni]|uniref:Uncharacterized protein n=1 Tax=Caenorhabditis nigoni TaxID=1611254 RepID=A0A2G5V348_9PELO|nr:hypothetical protein B9Z55_005966 [Caenorhabditis nigoni]